MDSSSVSDAGGNASYGTLASLFGVKGPWRLVPQGSTPKAHIIIKRDNYREQSTSGESSSGVARFSFIAGKKFTISKGQPLLFALASPNDQDGKTLLYDDTTFLLEADLAPSEESIEEHTELPANDIAQQMSGRKNIASLPPKMRKSYAKQKSYASFVESEPPSSLGFVGYPLGAPSTRIYSTAAVQTDLPPSISSSPSKPAATTVISPSDVNQHDNSPVQLPSPVSANHALERTSDRVAQAENEEAEFSREERSLSPMDLSSASCTPASSPPRVLQVLPEEIPEAPLASAQPHLLLANVEPVVEPSSLSMETTTSTPPPPPAVADEWNPVSPPPQSKSLSPVDNVFDPVPPPSQPIPLAISSCPASSLPLSPPPQLPGKAKEIEHKRNSAGDMDEVTVKKELILQSEMPRENQNAVASSSKILPEHERTSRSEGIPTNPRAMVQATRNTGGLLSLRAQEKLPVQPSPKPSVPNSIPLKSSSSQIRSASPPPDPKAIAYIPSGSSSNPLGIRPSISMHSAPKLPPTGPRSLVSTVNLAKKPIVVGAKWSAARNTGSSSNISNGGLSASTSSSSLTSVTSTSSPVIPASSTPTAVLSHILRYASPSPPPPPPPQTDPPPPLPPQTGATKWKRITAVDQESDRVSTTPILESRSPVITQTEPTNTVPSGSSVSLKRSYDEVKAGQTEVSDAHASKKAKSSSPPPPPSASPSSVPVNSPTVDSSSSSKRSRKRSSASKTAAAHQKSNPLPPMTHPLPAKPVPASSSYRPAPKRERTPEVPEPKRPPPRTDWPSTSSSANYQLQSCGPSSNPSIQKIVFNSDGTLMALICGDRTLRVWENKQAASEIARLSHNASIASVCWTQGDAAIMTLTVDGILSTWTRKGKEWSYTKLLAIPDVAQSDGPVCMAYHKDRIAVTTPAGVKIWLLINGTWQIQRDLVRSGVTAIRFVEDGEALIGGCRDGVVWHCKIPNGNLRVHIFLPTKPITSIDIHPTGSYILVGQEGGKSHLVTMKANENKGVVERTYTTEKLQSMNQTGFAAVFATKGQAVLYGTVNGCALVWDRKKGMIVYGLKHPDGDPIQAVATFDGRAGVEGMMITGTKQGRLFWWPQPVAAAPTQSGSGSGGQRRG